MTKVQGLNLIIHRDNMLTLYTAGSAVDLHVPVKTSLHHVARGFA